MKKLFFAYERLKSRLLFSVRSRYWRYVLKECGPGLCVYGRVVIRTPERVTVGHNCRFNEGLTVLGTGDLQIGSHVHLAGQVILATSGLNYREPGRPHFSQKITIGDHAWLGAGSMVRPGVTIGEGCIIGMGSVVTRDIPPYSVAVGSPAKVIAPIEYRLECRCNV